MHMKKQKAALDKSIRSVQSCSRSYQADKRH